jgi:hypothetical protein
VLRSFLVWCLVIEALYKFGIRRTDIPVCPVNRQGGANGTDRNVGPPD